MIRLASALVLVGVVAVGAAWGQLPANLAELRQKDSISQSEREGLRAAIEQMVQAMLTNTDPDRRGMVAAREGLLQEVEDANGRTDGYRRAFAEELLAVLKKADKRAVSQVARVNFMMVVARLRSIEAAELLQSALAKDPYPASRYWAAKGLAMLAPKIVEGVVPRLEAEIAETVSKVLVSETSVPTLLLLFEALGRFDHERAHDVLAAGVIQVAQRTDVADPLAARLWSQVIRALERAYAREVRPEAKKQILMAYATMCAQILPPTDVEVPPPDLTRLMTDLDASLQKITGESVGFAATDPQPLQKLALLEWVERLVRTKQIPRRPPLPKVVEEAVEGASPAPSPGGGTAEPPASAGAGAAGA